MSEEKKKKKRKGKKNCPTPLKISFFMKSAYRASPACLPALSGVFTLLLLLGAVKEFFSEATGGQKQSAASGY